MGLPVNYRNYMYQQPSVQVPFKPVEEKKEEKVVTIPFKPEENVTPTNEPNGKTQTVDGTIGYDTNNGATLNFGYSFRNTSTTKNGSTVTTSVGPYASMSNVGTPKSSSLYPNDISSVFSLGGKFEAEVVSPKLNNTDTQLYFKNTLFGGISGYSGKGQEFTTINNDKISPVGGIGLTWSEKLAGGIKVPESDKDDIKFGVFVAEQGNWNKNFNIWGDETVKYNTFNNLISVGSVVGWTHRIKNGSEIDLSAYAGIGSKITNGKQYKNDVTNGTPTFGAELKVKFPVKK